MSDKSDINAEQFSKLVSSLQTELWVLLRRRQGGWNDSDEPWRDRNEDVLDDREKELYAIAKKALTELSRSVVMPDMVKLAHAIPDVEKIVNTPEIDELYEPYDSPISKFMMDNPGHESIRLAMVILEGAGYEESVPTLLGVLSGELERLPSVYKRDRPVWLCSRCEGDGCLGGKPWRRDNCEKCNGWGHLLQEEDDHSEVDLSLEGRKALNKGEPWTVEDEAVASGYTSLADAESDGFQPPEFFTQAG
jgi:hypothetical protein